MAEKKVTKADEAPAIEDAAAAPVHLNDHTFVRVQGVAGTIYCTGAGDCYRADAEGRIEVWTEHAPALIATHALTSLNPDDAAVAIKKK